MSYSITLSNGSQLFELSDGIIDSIHTSISLVGKNSVNFGQAQNNDLVHLLENFANISPPPYPLTGQIWYNTQSKTLTVYKNGNWDPISIISYAASAPASPNTGNLWFDTTVNQLKIHDGSNFNVIGPEAVSSFAKTRMASETLKDISGGIHPVIKCTLNGTIIAVLSADDFDVAYDNVIDGIPHVYSGLTMKSGYSIAGTSSIGLKTNSLLGANGTSYRIASVISSNNSIVERDDSGGINVNKLSASNLYSNSGLISGTWTVSGSVTPTINAAINLGSAALKWANVYTDVVTANSINTPKVSVTTASIDIITFNNLVDKSNNIITDIDKDSTLAASSDSKLATQKAIKSYVDAAVQTAITQLTNANTTLDTKINGITSIPSGTVFYHAGPTAPAGYLVADGSTISRSTYFNLWTALGGTASPYGQTLQTFNLPDLRGEFIRGLDKGRGIDANRTIGSNQSSQNLAHTHSYTLRNGGNNPWWQYANAATVSGYETNQTGSSGGSEARPRNVALLPIIKI